MRTCPGRATLSSMNSAAAPPPYPPSSRDPGPGPPLPPPRTRELTTAQLGRLGEELAVRQLQRQGWQIIERNLRLTQGELDIVALEATTLVFIKVKTRRSFVTGLPQAAVTPAKLRRLRRLAGEFLMDHRVPHCDVRLDVIAIHAQVDDTFALEHLRAVG